MTSEEQIEMQIQAAGKIAPRVTSNLINNTIVDEDYHNFPGTSLTICALTLRNGFVVTGESASASIDNFDPEIGRRIARDNARHKIWALESYLLRESLFQQSLLE